MRPWLGWQQDYADSMPLLLLLFQVLPGPVAGEDLREQINGLAQLQELDPEQLNELQRACQQQPVATAKLLPRLSCHELYLVSSAIAGCDFDSPITDALVGEALRRPQPTTALACLLAPRRVPLARLPDLAKMALNPNHDLALRSAALVRLLEHGCVSAWPVARSVLLSGTARDRITPWATWERSGKYELPKRILKVEIEALIRHLSPHPDSISSLAFEPNGSWQAQVAACTQLESRLLPLLSSARDTADLSTHSRQQQESFQRAVGLLLRAGDHDSLQAVTLLLPHALPTMMAALANRELKLSSAARRCTKLKPQ